MGTISVTLDPGTPTASDGLLSSNNIVSFLDVDSRLSYILAIVAGAIFAAAAFFALINLFRDKFGVHLFIIVFALERVATYVMRALVYQNPRRLYIEIFELLEGGGTMIIITVMYHLWAGTARSKSVTRSGRASHCCTLFFATLAASAGSGIFMAGVILQDRLGASNDEIDRGNKLRKIAVIVWGGVLAFLDLLTFSLLFKKGSRKSGFALLVASGLLSAKAGFQIYALWQDLDIYYKNAYYWPFIVLTELLVLAIITFPGFVRRSLQPPARLPLTDVHGQQYIAGTGGAVPYAPAYAPTPQGYQPQAPGVYK